MHRRFNTTAHIHLPEYRAEMELHGDFREFQLARDVLAGKEIQ